MKDKLGEVIIERLSYLSQNQPRKFEAINAWHHEQLKGMAVFYDSFFDKAVEMLLFETNKGMMSLKDYLSKNEALPDKRAPIYFFSYAQSAAQYYRLADAKGIVIINTGYVFDETVLKKYAEKNSDKVKLSQFDTLGDGVIFSDLNEEERSAFAQLEKHFMWELRRGGAYVDVSTKRFSPPDIPALSVATEKEEAEEKLQSFINDPRLNMRDIWMDVLEKRRPTKLLLNAENPLIKKLISMENPALRYVITLGIYNNAMLYAHRMTPESMTLVHDCMAKIMSEAISLQGQNETLDKKVELLRTEQRERAALEENADKPDHIRVFMITPFSGYNEVEKAVRAVFENAPFFFEVRLARDYTHKGQRLIDSVKQHIASSHAFIAEISQLNANVMLEAGAILMRMDNRPVFTLRSSDAVDDIPADLKHKLNVNYNTPTDAADVIASVIRNEFIKDGRIAHEDLEELIKIRKALFLSRTLLDADTRLSDDEKNEIMREYKTVESFMKATPEEISAKTNVHRGIIMAAQDGLTPHIKR